MVYLGLGFLVLFFLFSVSSGVMCFHTNLSQSQTFSGLGGDVFFLKWVAAAMYNFALHPYLVCVLMDKIIVP